LGGLGTTIAKNNITDSWGNAAFQAQVSSGYAYNGANFIGLNGVCPAMDYYTSNSTDGDTQEAVAAGVQTYWLYLSADDGVTTTGINGAALNAFVDGTVSEGIVPMQWTFQVQNQAGTLIQPLTIRSSGNVGIGTATPQQLLTVGAGGNLANEITAPAVSSLSGTTGGSLSAGTYYYKITALDVLGGETKGGPESSYTLGGSDNAITVNWSPVPGAAAYRIYRGTSSGGENVYHLATGPTSFTDPGGGTSASPPSVTAAYVAKIGPSIGSLNQIVFLSPNGSTDGTAINAAITSLPSNGGIIMLTPGTYGIDETIVIAKDGVKLRGYGGTWEGDGSGSTTVPLTLLQWLASSGAGPVVSLASPNTVDLIQDLEVTDLTIDGGGVAATGLALNQVMNSRLIKMHVQNLMTRTEAAYSTGILLTTSATANHIGTSWNLFENCSAIGASIGVKLTKSTSASANSCHNRFIGLNVGSYGANSADAGIWLDVCDNNTFVAVWILMDGGVGHGVLVTSPTTALSNYFYHLQPGAGGFYIMGTGDTPPVPNQNFVFGYDQSNGEPDPTTDSSNPAYLYLNWTNSAGVSGNLSVIGTVQAGAGVCLRTFGGSSHPTLSVNEVAFWFAASGPYAGMGGLLFYDGGNYWWFAAAGGMPVTAMVNP
jgi:hypothetical protein